MSFKVGDILWVVGRERPGVRVYQVVEELTKKTLSGTVTTYKAQTPAPPGKAKKVTIDSLDGEVYSDVESAKEAMRKRTELAIEKMISANQNLIDKFCTKKELEEILTNTKKENVETNNENIVTLPDGTEARLKINVGDVL